MKREGLFFEKDITIDENALDIEWLDQPALVLKYSQYAAKCKQLLDLAKENIDIKRAELDQKIRKNPEKYKIDKVTETAISNAILLDEDFQEIKNEYIDKKYEAEMAQAAVWALQDKKAALENLVRLNGQSYFAGPSVPRDLSREAQKRKDQYEANAAVKFTMTRNKK